MNVLKYAFGVVVVTAAIVAGASKPVQATAACDVEAKQLGQWGTSFQVNGSQITATFKVTGDSCTTPVTLAVWNSEGANGHPLDKQTLYGHATGTFGPGTHTLTTTLPKDCFYQADLVKSANPKAADGTANYQYQNGQFVDGGLRDFKYGGNKKCEPKKPDQPKQPEQPQQPQQPGGQGAAPQVQAVQTPQNGKLVETGPAAVVGTFAAVSTGAGVVHNVVQRRRKVQ